MGYYISSMIGIRTGGVFSGEVDIDDMKARIARIVREFREAGKTVDLGDEHGDPSHCMSRELEGHKGSYVVLAAVFNYWDHKAVGEFAAALSKEFGTEVMQMTWDQERDSVDAATVWLDGKPSCDVEENPIGRMLRHVS